MNLCSLFGSLPALLDQYGFLAASSVQFFCFGLVFDPHNTVKDHFMSYSIHSCMKLALLLNS